MKDSNIEERLAVIGALIVLFGVSMAAEDALADDAAITSTAIAIHEAAARAAESPAFENWIELDIRLEDHTSVMIAGRE